MTLITSCVFSQLHVNICITGATICIYFSEYVFVDVYSLYNHAVTKLTLFKIPSSLNSWKTFTLTHTHIVVCVTSICKCMYI